MQLLHSLFTEKHIHFTTPDDVMTLVLFKFLFCSFYDKRKERKKKKNTINVLKISNTLCFVINAVTAQEHML